MSISWCSVHMTPSMEVLFLAGAKVPVSKSRAIHRLPVLMLMWHSAHARATDFICCRIFTKKMARWLRSFVIKVTRSGMQERISRGAWRTSWSHEDTKEVLQFSIFSKYKKRKLRPFLTVWVLRTVFGFFFPRTQFSEPDPYDPMYSFWDVT